MSQPTFQIARVFIVFPASLDSDVYKELGKQIQALRYYAWLIICFLKIGLAL